MSESDRSAPEVILASDEVYSGRVLKLRVDTVRLANGRESKREIVVHRGAVAIVPLDDQGNCLLVRQYRSAIGSDLLEIPAGTLEPGEDPAVCAARELAEETGYRPGRLVPLAGFFSAPGFCTEYLWVYLATDLVHDPRAGDEDEEISLVRQPLEKCIEQIRGGEIRDAKSIVGLLAVQAGWGRQCSDNNAE